MKLYSAPLSLFARKVEIALAEKGLAFERIMVPFSQTTGYSPKHPEVLAVNPKGQVPVLVDGDLALYDSTLILEYLEDAYPEPPLFPREPAERARCRTLDLFADEVMLVPLRTLMHRTGPRSPEPGRWQAQEAAASEAIPRIGAQHAELDVMLAGRAFLLETISVADIAVFMQVLYSQRLGGPTLDAVPNIAAWYGRLKSRPPFAAVVAEIAAADRELSEPVDGGRL